jgi:DNA ligase (NAD+)
MRQNSFQDRLWMLGHLGFDFAPYMEITSNATSNMIQTSIDIIKKFSSDQNYPIDGCVFGYNDVAYGDSLGATGHHIRSQIAFKFYDELHETKLLHIDWTIGKTGVLTPTAVFEPVEIDGTEVSRASLHNISIIKSLGLTNNCTVRVYKANMIIPQIDSCEQDGTGEIVIPSVCPICGQQAVIKKENESEVLMCINPDCSAKKIARFTHFVSRKCMNIDGLSEKTLEVLLSHGFVRNFRDVYYLSNHYNQLICLDGFGKKSVENLLNSIEESRNVNLANFICALGIPTIGSSASKTIAEYCEYDIATFLKLLWESRWNTGFSWTELNDFGEVAAKNLDEYFDKNAKMLRELADEMNFIIPEKKVVTDNPFTGKTLCVTGKLNHFTRDSINEKITSLGAKAAGSVSKKTDYLITNESSGSSKYKKAIELGVPIITEEEFIIMAN